jgi:hypothetical protein
MIESINNIFGITNDVSVPILISLIVFITGGFITYIFDKISAYQQRVQLRNTFLLLINQTTINLKTKEKYFQLFFPTLNVEHNDSWSLTNSPLSYLDTFFELNFADLYNAFRKKIFWSCSNKNLKNKAFHKVWSILRNLKFIESQIESNLNEMITKFTVYQNKYNESLLSYRKFFDDIIRDKNGKELPKELANFIVAQDKLWYKWEQKEESDRVKYFVTYNEIVKPVIELLKVNSSLPITKEIDVALLDCAHQYIQMEALLHAYQDLFYSHYMSYKASRRSLNKILKILN